jgi:site-specific recombinase XerD
MSTIAESPFPEVRSFLASLAAKNRSDETIRSYRDSLAKYMPFLAAQGVNVYAATPWIIEDWILSLREAKLSEASVSSRLAAAKAFYKWAENRELVDKNPCKRISFVPKNCLPRNPDIEEARRFIDSIDGRTWIGARDKAVILAMYGSGCRVSELSNVRLSDLIGNQMKVLGKGNKERLCLVADQALEAIHYWIKHHRSERMPENDYLFVNLAGGQLLDSGIQQMMERRRRESGVLSHDTYKSGCIRYRISAHAFRHLFATQLLDNNAEIRAIQELMGHVNIATTQRYTKVSTTLKARTHALLPVL